MSFIANIILANTPEEKEAAHEALRQFNSNRPSDREVVAAFLKDCSSLDSGTPLALGDDGSIVTLQ